MCACGGVSVRSRSAAVYHVNVIIVARQPLISCKALNIAVSYWRVMCYVYCHRKGINLWVISTTSPLLSLIRLTNAASSSVGDTNYCDIYTN